ncbi:hypothetical protein V5799_023112 [Amblyomma americanum]|uniref:Phosphatidylethanolamine-binding protein n=1 Tax=Amblyomma americanum TaxID=6943 RepID=A0AAQ4FK93_AMBAM
MRHRIGAALLLAIAAATTLLALLSAPVCSAAEPDKRERELLKKAEASKIAPDLIEAIPKAVFEATFPRGQVSMGNFFTLDQASKNPSNIAFPRTPGAKYTIAMLDPDVPTMKDHKFSPILHWLVVNVESGDVKAPVDFKTGFELYKYRGPKPPMGAGPHRYVFLAYKQSKAIDSPQSLIVPFEKRKNYNLAKFANDHGLGKPIAVNYFISENCHTAGYTPFVVCTTVFAMALTGLVGRLVLLQVYML